MSTDSVFDYWPAQNLKYTAKFYNITTDGKNLFAVILE